MPRYLSVFETYADFDDLNTLNAEPRSTIRFEYPRVTLPYTDEPSKQNAILDCKTVIEASRIRDRATGSHNAVGISFHIVDQEIVETL